MQSPRGVPEVPGGLFPVPDHPVVIRGGCKDWPAAQWNWAFLEAVLGSAIVSVSCSNEESSVTRKLDMPLSTFISGVRDRCGGDLDTEPAPQLPPLAATAAPSTRHPRNVKQLDVSTLPAPFCDGAATAFNALYTQRTCRASTPTRSWLHAVGRTLCVPITAAWRALVRPYVTARFLWIGEPGSVTGLHNDDEHSVMVVIRGCKRVTLFPPSQAHLLAPNTKYDSGTACFSFDPAAPDVVRHPTAASATPWQVDVRGGDVLFVPAFWLHHVASLSPSITLNAFCCNVVEDATRGVARRCVESLHYAGVYGSFDNCVCHAVPAPDDAAPVAPPSTAASPRWLLPVSLVSLAVASAVAWTIGRRSRG